MELHVVTIQPSAPHTHTVVFLHGRGDNARNFSRTVGYSWDSHNRTLFEAFPSFRWVFPQAPPRRCANKGNIMFQWFDTWSTADFSEREELQVSGLQEIVPAIRLLLADEAARVEGRWGRLVLAGISMGGATSAHTVFNLAVPPSGPETTPRPGRLGALMTFSSRCPFVGRSLEEIRAVLGLQDVPDHADVLRNTPMLLEHCVDDPLVPITTGRALRDTMSRFGAQVTWKEYPTGGHWFNSPAGMDDTVVFLNQYVLGADAEGETGTGETQAEPQAGVTAGLL